MSTFNLAPVFAVATALLVACSTTPQRPAKPSNELSLLTQHFVRQNNADYDATRESMLGRMELEVASATDPEEVTFDVLVIHGGGPVGGFAAGFLKGWGEVSNPAFARPGFDLVTGSSSGALVAPYAFVGSEPAYGRAYQTALRPPTFEDPSLVSLLPSSSALMSNAPLKEGIDSVFDAAFIQAIADGAREQRSLLIGVTDLDVGRGRSWDVTREVSSLPPDRACERTHRILLASTAIPVVFPPVEIDGRLYTDGGVASTMFMGFDVFAVEWLLAQWQQRHPNLPMPALRVWVIVNAKLFIDEATVQPRYLDIAMRSIKIMMEYDRLKALFMMAFMVREMDSIDGVRAEFRYVAVPDDATIPKDLSELGDESMIRGVVDLGYRMGTDPRSWTEGAPMLLRMQETDTP